ncbi:hypothetical protein NJ7G_3906 [Natrinema sp. J7-2]|nr:hypothetical protein NJ7G_3906 [Natrinema sp. J7-2]
MSASKLFNHIPNMVNISGVKYQYTFGTLSLMAAVGLKS